MASEHYILLKYLYAVISSYLDCCFDELEVMSCTCDLDVYQHEQSRHLRGW